MQQLLCYILLSVPSCKSAGVEVCGAFNNSSHLEMGREAILVVGAFVEALGIIGSSELKQLQIPLCLSIQDRALHIKPATAST